jgi:hypothetical protein
MCGIYQERERDMCKRLLKSNFALGKISSGTKVKLFIAWTEIEIICNRYWCAQKIMSKG